MDWQPTYRTHGERVILCNGQVIIDVDLFKLFFKASNKKKRENLQPKQYKNYKLDKCEEKKKTNFPNQ